MTDWFEGLSFAQQFLFSTGVFATLVFAIQFVLSFLGLGDDELGAEPGALSFGDVFTIRNGVTFLMGFAWGGLMAYEWGLQHGLLIAAVGFFVGNLLMGLNILMLVALGQIRHDGSIRLENAIDARARVTLRIPGQRSGVGKVMVPIQGRLKEYHAVTDGAPLPRNSIVTVLDVIGSQLVVTGVDESRSGDLR